MSSWTSPNSVTPGFPHTIPDSNNTTNNSNYYYYDDDADGSEENYTGFRVNIISYVIAVDVVAVIGIIGNVLTVVLMTSPALRRHSYAVYMVFLSVADALVLVTIATEDNLDHIFDALPILNVHVICKLWQGFIIFVRLISPWILVAMTFDRFVAIVFPLKRISVCRQKIAFIVCISICMIGLVLVVPFLYYLKSVTDEDGANSCSADRENEIVLDTYSEVLQIAVQSVIPVSALLVLNTHTTIVLRRVSASCLRRTETGHSLNERKFLKITTSLILVSALSAVALVPIAVNSLVEFLLGLTSVDFYMIDMFGNIWYVLNVIQLLNYAMNFYVLIIFLDQYRAILRSKFKCAKADRAQNEVTVASLCERVSTSMPTDVSTVGL